MKPSASIVVLVISLFCPGSVLAQLSGQNMRGDTAIGAGSLPESGWSLNAFYSFYDVSDVRDDDGDRILRGTEAAAFNLRYLRDFGARSMTEGDTLTLSVTFPF